MRKHEKKTEPEPANAGPEAEMMSIPRTEYAEPATEPEAALDELDEKDADLLVDDQSPLTENEKQEKAQAEAAIQKNGVSNGVEFLKLKRGKLFRADFKSFGAYHKAVFPQYKRSTIFYWMGLAKAIEKVADPELATAKQNVIAAMGKKTDEEIEHIQQRREETAKAWNEMTAGDVDTMV